VCRVNRACFTDADTVVVTVGEDGYARRWDAASGKQLAAERVHQGVITDMQARVCDMSPPRLQARVAVFLVKRR
jgi:hypothetical protein